MTFSLMTLKVRVALCRVKGARNLPCRVIIRGRSCLVIPRRRHSGLRVAGRMCIHDGLLSRNIADSLVCIAPRLPAHGYFLNVVEVTA